MTQPFVRAIPNHRESRFRDNLNALRAEGYNVKVYPNQVRLDGKTFISRSALETRPTHQVLQTAARRSAQ